MAIADQETGRPITVLAPLLALTALAVGLSFFQVEHFALFFAVGIIGLVSVWKRPEYGILVFLATFLITYPSYFQDILGISPNNLLGIIFSVLLVRKWQLEKDLWFLHISEVRWLSAIGIILLVSYALSPKPPSFGISTGRVEKEMWDFFSQLAFFIFTIHFTKTRRDLNLIFGLLLVMIVASTPSSLHFSLNPGEDYRAAASWGIQMGKNSNHLAFFSIVGIIILWYKNQEVSSHLLRCASFGIIGLLLLVVFLCASRNALLNMVFLGVILTVDAGIQPKKIFATALIIICLATAMVFVVPEQNLKRMTAFQMDASQPEAASSSRDRFQTVKTALQIFSDHSPLIGVGPGNFRWIRQLYYDHKQLATHNSYLWALVSGGVPLLLAFLGLFRAILKDLRRLEANPHAENGPPQWMVKAIRTSLLVFFLFAFFTEAFLGLFPFLFAALAVVMMRMQQEESTAIS